MLNYNQLAYRAELRGQNAATLYFSAVGAASVPSLPALYGPFSTLNVLAECRENRLSAGSVGLDQVI